MKLQIFLLLLSLSVYGSDSGNTGGLNRVQQQIKQTNVTHKKAVEKADRAVNKIRDQKKEKISTKTRAPKLGPKPKPKKKKYSGNIHRDYVIYNLERTDTEIRHLNRDVDDLYEIANKLEERGNAYIETFEIFLVQYKEQMDKNARYDHFFTKWDALEEILVDIGTLGGGSIGTIILGLFGFWYNKRRKRKKENGGEHDKPTTKVS